MQHKIYWQKQGADRLCGVHCVNCLLQGPFFNEVDLAQMALELDKKEQTLMLEQGMTSEAIKYLKQDSSNVAMDGYYSIQVLQAALKTLNLVMVNIDTLKSGEDLVKKTGFIFNSSDHWFSLRKIDNVWYNLNSTNKRLPEIISDFYLSAFLIAVKNGGYQIFSIEGEYPESSEDRWQYYNNNQVWIEKKRVQKYHQKCIKRKGFKPNIGGAGADDEMEKAIALSMGKNYEKYVSSGEDEDWDNDNPKKPQLKEFGGMGVGMSEEVVVNYPKFHLSEEDFDMIEFMKQSLGEQFKNEPKQGKLVLLRYSNGKKEQRIFPSNAEVQTLYDYVWHKHSGRGTFYLTNFQNKEKLVDVSIPLFAIEDEDGTVIVMVNDQ